MAARLVLDTSAYVHFRGGHELVTDRIAKAEVVFIPAVVLGELHAGAHLGKRGAENRMWLEEFLEESFVSTLPVTPGVAERYGQLFAELRRARTPIPTNDIWIAATTMDAAAHLLTFDRDFARVRKLERTILKAQKPL